VREEREKRGKNYSYKNKNVLSWLTFGPFESTVETVVPSEQRDCDYSYYQWKRKPGYETYTWK
jgi:hypothetical protein